MLEEPIAHSGEMIVHAAQLLSTYFKKTVQFSKIIQLSESGRRNLILRLEIANSTADMPKTVVLKMTAIEKQIFEAAANAETEIETEQEQTSRFAHDWAGLEFLTEIGGNHAPKFLIGSVEYKFILIEDLGVAHPSLVGPLTRAASLFNLQEAKSALLSYVSRLGKMHADTAGKSEQFIAILKRVYPQALHYNYVTDLDAEIILNHFKKFTGNETQELTQEIYSIIEFSQSKNEFTVFLHGDICPDNVYYQNNEMRFIDFEFGDFGNALIDATYLRMHMPSCWCSKAVPFSIVHEMEATYREELIKGVPSAADDVIFNKQLAYACAYWLIKTLKGLDEFIAHEWICPSGPVDPDSQWEPDKNAFRPRILSRLESFILCIKETDHLPNLKNSSIELLSYLRKIWPEAQNIDMYPVFK